MIVGVLRIFCTQLNLAAALQRLRGCSRLPSDRVETRERASVSSIPFLSFSIFSLAAAAAAAVSGEIKIVGRKLLCSWCE